MRHVVDGVIRRVLDEPEAVSDKALAHVGSCRRCRSHMREIEMDTAALARSLAPLQPLRDVAAAWERVATRVQAVAAAPQAPNRRFEPGTAGSLRARLAGRSLGTAGIVVAGALLVAGTAAAAGWSTLFAPTHVAPLAVTTSDVSAISSILGIEPNMVSSGPGSTRTFAFGTVTMVGFKPSVVVANTAEAERLTGLTLRLPAHPPAGIGSPEKIVVEEPASLRVDVASGPSIPADIAGTSILVSAGPAVVVEYGGDAPGLEIPTLAVVSMRRPTAVSMGASVAQLEDFLLAQPGFPAGLAQDIRLLGAGGTTLPVPTPPGMSAQSADVGGSQAVVVSVPHGIVSGVVWEDSAKVVHAVAGLLGASEVVGLARQIG